MAATRLAIGTTLGAITGGVFLHPRFVEGGGGVMFGRSVGGGVLILESSQQRKYKRAPTMHEPLKPINKASQMQKQIWWHT